jgi:hypothetical protein
MGGLSPALVVGCANPHRKYVHSGIVLIQEPGEGKKLYNETDQAYQDHKIDEIGSHLSPFG